MRHLSSFALLSVIVFLSIVLSSSSQVGTPERIQTRDTLQRLYGSSVSEIYCTSQNLTITTSFAGNGSLCSADIESPADIGITDSQLNTVLDQLAPEDVRGKHKLSTFQDMTCLKRLPEHSTSQLGGKPTINLVVDPCADCSGISDDDERATITRSGSTIEYSSVRIMFRRPEYKQAK